ncbi:hypothetical protein [Gordonia rubripertincta]|uniref:hypothetical protein n=1 Tax=Gordonia rubripertincta TaxID=36822 RepID=UPI0015FCA1F4|nr:hypothetical protein [Gordonia rubripertincta]QMU22076.1 hypothetical protein H3V45_06175 [Gordonia rubripertincta]
MAEVTIRAEQRVAGLVPGTVVTVERTGKIEKLIAHGRVTIVDPDAAATDLADAQAEARETLDRLNAELDAEEKATDAENTADATEQTPATSRRKKPTGDAS